MKNPMALVVFLSFAGVFAGCAALQGLLGPTGEDGPSPIQEGIAIGQTVAPLFGPVGLWASGALGILATIAEGARRYMKRQRDVQETAKDRLEHAARILVDTIQDIKQEDVDTAAKILDKIRDRADGEYNLVVQHLREDRPYMDSRLAKAGVQ